MPLRPQVTKERLTHEKFTTIAHRDHVICNPIGSEKIDRVVGLLDLPALARVLEVGCGKAELLVRLAERYDCTAVGIDLNSTFLTEARARAFDRGVGGHIELIQDDAATARFPGAPFDAAMCVGATHAFGGYIPTLKRLKGLVKPGGKIVLGEGYWIQRPDVGYLKALGAKQGDFTDHAGNVEAGLAEGMIYLYSVVASTDDFDQYEGLYNHSVESWCLENPNDLDTEAARERIRAWRDAYLKWGRGTLGFGVYLFQV
jgi:SAM-dependent methyltransferase